MLLNVHVDTEYVQTQLTIKCFHQCNNKESSDSDVSELKQCLTVNDAIRTVHERYHQWHSFSVYEFALVWPPGTDAQGEVIDSKLTLQELGFDSTAAARKNACYVIETDASKTRREKERIAEEEERKRREEEALIKEKQKQEKIKQIKQIGRSWQLESNSVYIDVPIECDGLVARNKGSLDQWCAIISLNPIPARKQYFRAIKVNKLPETSNTWKLSIGVVPLSFKINSERRWVGSQKSWGYIGGTGGKCHDSGKSVPYGDPYTEGDVIGVLLDFAKGQLEFFKNGSSQGIAFEDIHVPVHLACSLTAKDSEIAFDDNVPVKMRSVVSKWEAMESKTKQRWQAISAQSFQDKLKRKCEEQDIDVWDVCFSLAKDKALCYETDILNIVRNEGSGDKWRVCRSLRSYNSGAKFFELIIRKDSPTANTWRFCFGIAPSSFKAADARAWVGAQNSWAYIAGTGGKAFNSGQSTAYGDPFEIGDVIGILLNFAEKTIEFFKNGISQGIAFRNLEGSVHAVASFTGTDSAVLIRDGGIESISQYKKDAFEREVELARIVMNYGNIWDPCKCSRNLDIDDNGTRVKNKGSKDKWRAIGGLLPYSSGRRYFEIVIEANPSSGNSWKICVGVVPKSFDFGHQKLWVGAQGSWGYIGGTGGKCFDSGRTTSYASKFGKADRIGVLMDFDNHTLEFYKNSVSQGIAFTQLEGPVIPAVSLTGKGASVLIDASVEKDAANMSRLFLYH